MTLDETTEKRVYEKLRAYDGLAVSDHEPVDASIASVLREGEVLADDGNQYSSIQDAVDASDGWTFVGPGTYYENVTIDKDDFILQGAGQNTVIDGGDAGHAIECVASNGAIKNLKVTASGSSVKGISASNSTDMLFDNLYITSNQEGIRTGGNSIVKNCHVVDCTNQHGIQMTGGSCIIIGNTVDNCGTSGAGSIDLDGDDNIVANNVITNAIDRGINAQSTPEDSIIISNRVHNSAGTGILVNVADVIIANNRVSNSGSGTDISSTASNVTDGNLTGAAN